MCEPLEVSQSTLIYEFPYLTIRLLALDESWQFWFSPFFKLRGLVSGFLPSRAKNAPTRTILHKFVHSITYDFRSMCSNLSEGPPVFWSPVRCVSYLAHQDPVVPLF